MNQVLKGYSAEKFDPHKLRALVSISVGALVTLLLLLFIHYSFFSQIPLKLVIVECFIAALIVGAYVLSSGFVINNGRLLYKRATTPFYYSSIDISRVKKIHHTWRWYFRGLYVQTLIFEYKTDKGSNNFFAENNLFKVTSVMRPDLFDDGNMLARSKNIAFWKDEDTILFLHKLYKINPGIIFPDKYRDAINNFDNPVKYQESISKIKEDWNNLNKSALVLVILAILFIYLMTIYTPGIGFTPLAIFERMFAPWFEYFK